MQRINTTAKRIINHYELDDQGAPKLYTDIDSFGIVMGEFGAKHEYTTPNNYLANDNKKVSEYKFLNGLKVHAEFMLNEFKQYQLTHLILGS